MAEYNLPADLSTDKVSTDELDALDTLILAKLSALQNALAGKSATEITAEQIASIKAYKADRDTIQVELSTRAAAEEEAQAEAEALAAEGAEALALLEEAINGAVIVDETDTAELAEETEGAEEASEATEEVVAEEVAADTTEELAAEETTEEVAEEAADEAAETNINLTVNVNTSTGEVETEAVETAEETIELSEEAAEEVVAEETTEVTEEAADAEATETLTDEAAAETTEEVAEEATETVELSEEAVAEETEATEVVEETEASAEETLSDEATEEAADEAVDAEATEALNVEDGTEANDNNQENTVSSDEHKVEEMTETELNATEAEASLGNATIMVGPDGQQYGSGFQNGQLENYSDVSRLFKNAYETLGGSQRWTNVRSGVSEFMRLATIVQDFEEDTPELSMSNPDGNTAILNAVANTYADRETYDEAPLVASGGICAPCDVDYSLNRIAVAMNPIESALPVVRAQRGCYTYSHRINWTQIARQGIGWTTPSEDAAGYVSTPVYAGGPGPTADKPCVAVPCPDTNLNCCVNAIHWCMRVGNFQMITWPEHIDAFMQDLMVAFAAEKEMYYLEQIDNGSTVQISATAPGYNLRTGLMWVLRAAMINYRKSLHLPIEGGAPFTLLLPDWLVEAIKVDYSNANNGELLSTGEVDAWLRRGLNVVPTYYYDPIRCDLPATMMADCKTDGGAVAEFPTTANIYFWNTGDVIRLTMGTLDFGMVRDHILNSTNDVIFMAEEFTSLCITEPPCKIIVTVCPSGVLPPRAAAALCFHDNGLGSTTTPSGNLPICLVAGNTGPGSICNDPIAHPPILPCP